MNLGFHFMTIYFNARNGWFAQEDSAALLLCGRWFYLRESDSAIFRLKNWVYIREGNNWTIRFSKRMYASCMSGHWPKLGWR